MPTVSGTLLCTGNIMMIKTPSWPSMTEVWWGHNQASPYLFCPNCYLAEMANIEGNLDAWGGLRPYLDKLLRQEEHLLVKNNKKLSLVDKLLLWLEYIQFCRTRDSPLPATLDLDFQNLPGFLNDPHLRLGLSSHLALCHS